MRSWTRPGAFTIDIPDDWSVTEEDGTVEIEPPTRTSACHVSTYRRLKSGPPTPAEAEELTRRFPAAQGLHDLMWNSTSSRSMSTLQLPSRSRTIVTSSSGSFGPGCRLTA